MMYKFAIVRDSNRNIIAITDKSGKRWNIGQAGFVDACHKALHEHIAGGSISFWGADSETISRIAAHNQTLRDELERLKVYNDHTIIAGFNRL